MTESEQPQSASEVSTPIESSSTTTSPDAISESSVSLGHWSLWMAAGLLAAVLSTGAVFGMVGYGMAALPPVENPIEQDAPQPETEEDRAAERTLLMTNQYRILMGVGLVVIASFSLFGGLRYHAFGRAAIGFLGGTLLMVVVSFLASGALIDLQKQASLSLTRTDQLGMLLHALQWMIVGLGVAATVGWIARSFATGLKSGLLFGLAAALGAVVYLIGGGIIDPQNTLHIAQPSSGQSVYLWTMVPPISAGLFMSRAQA